MYNTVTTTATYTVVDIRKTFEGFSADLRMIAARTEKMTSSQVENYLHDILVWAENKYLDYVDIALMDTNQKPIKASRYTIDENGKATQSDRAGSNAWQNIPNTRMTIIVSNSDAWNKLSPEQQAIFQRDNKFHINWVTSTIDNSYSHLSRENAQLYASRGYEVRKINFN